jgi:hypothetical protein
MLTIFTDEEIKGWGDDYLSVLLIAVAIVLLILAIKGNNVWKALALAYVALP